MDTNINNLTRLINSIYRCNQVYFDKRLKKFNLTIGTYPYLVKLNILPGISQNEISKELNVDKAMSARTIKKLIELGYVKKEENEEDTRAYRLYLTDKGKSIIPQIMKAIYELVHILVEGSSEEEIKISMQFLQRVLCNSKKCREHCCERMKKA